MGASEFTSGPFRTRNAPYQGWNPSLETEVNLLRKTTSNSMDGVSFMKLPPVVKRGVPLAAAFLLILQVRPSVAQQPHPVDGEADQVVARVAFLTGDVSYNRGDDPDDWQPAALNFPMTQGDRLFTTRGAKTELQTSGWTCARRPRSAPPPRSSITIWMSSSASCAISSLARSKASGSTTRKNTKTCWASCSASSPRWSAASSCIPA